MSELAFNVNGEPFEVPASAIGWRVKRLKAKGAPEVVYGRDGLPLVLPVDSDLDDLRVEVGTPGRYRLDPIDEATKPVPNGTPGYVFVHADARPVEGAASSGTRSSTSPSDNIVIEAMRMNAEMARTIIDRFPQMLESAATLLRAADGAGLPARLPQMTPGQEIETDDEDVIVPQGFDLNALVTQIVPMLISSLANGKMKMPALSSVLDWRKASQEANDENDASHALEAAEDASETLPPIDAKTMSHFVSIQSVLDPKEAELAREVASSLPPGELRAWFDELTKLTVAEAVKKIRVMLTKRSAL